jgi:DNA-binding response OmpR family regulator
MRVLVVCARPDAARLVAVLERDGHEVTLATSVLTGWSELVHHRPLKVAVDSALPGFDEVARLKWERRLGEEVIRFDAAAGEVPALKRAQ